jgi:hypothetical protein
MAFSLIPQSFVAGGIPDRDFEAADFVQGTEYFTVSHSSAGNRREMIILLNVNRDTTGTEYVFGNWNLSTVGDLIGFNGSDKFNILFSQVSVNTLLSTRTFTTGTWYSFVLSIDTNNGTANDRLRLWELYDEEGEITSFTTRNNPSSGTQADRLNTNSNWQIASGGDGNRFDGKIGPFLFLDGVSIQQGDYAISDFYDIDGGSYFLKSTTDLASIASTVGGNSFCLDMMDSGDLDNDASTNNNDATTTGTPTQHSYTRLGP